MPLFRDYPIRSTICIAIAIGLGHTVTKLLNSLYAFHLTQTSVAILGICGFMLLIAMNHQHGEEQHLMTQMQQEMVLIVGFGLLWIAVSLGWKAITGQGMSESPGFRSEVQPHNRGGSLNRPYPCTDDDIYCIVEEYSYF